VLSRAVISMSRLLEKPGPVLFSPECVEEDFCELRHNAVLRSSGASLVLWSTYSFLIQEYADLVTWPSECHVKAQDRYLHLLLDQG
jgi:hypothetical protein